MWRRVLINDKPCDDLDNISYTDVFFPFKFLNITIKCISSYLNINSKLYLFWTLNFFIAVWEQHFYVTQTDELKTVASLNRAIKDIVKRKRLFNKKENDTVSLGKSMVNMEIL